MNPSLITSLHPLIELDVHLFIHLLFTRLGVLVASTCNPVMSDKIAINRTPQRLAKPPATNRFWVILQRR